MTLQELIKGGLSYDRNWHVYAEKIDGKFCLNSKARFGQAIFENGGLMDNYEYFGNNEDIVDFIATYTDGDNEYIDEAIEELIWQVNEEQ